ncbi:ABC transporter substrate-binding protein [Aliivibrio fischeri]|uniref:ABC transporter, periplasmic component n=1 Tax=Aliivibrio fischeri (strain ATCC 700601 / ES114) TaxID=312309 RepID=Q5DYV3_ALIF1|nr:ABC transporter substrate-binding protein [Aliivibrio fischeri]AAW88043.1 ABC transporter, periplasmic component [Aliivibrio fischeri ES114]KLU80519.1 ABC transporter substrate-binding protein [Aliivibrio fischeri]MCE7536194.1 ABC transporter substrate-binding protein [Aliivibrio fischeri]MCE7558980.1 ABC transporter substrate-binding protein [Aliivibrio fischeri]MCE7565528.1 ABC transporter substrate-binding protein [Aliivibrio fischeri]
MRWLALNPFIIVFSLLLSWSTMAETTYPLHVVDGLGNTVILEKAPTKISSKTLFTDAVLLELVDKEQLSSLTDLANNPNYSAIKDILPKSIPLLALNVEMIIANRPDIVFAANWSDASKLAIIESAGIPVYRIQTPNTLKEVETEILRVGDIVNRRLAAERVIEDMQQRLQQEVILPKKRLTALDYNPWGTSSGQDSTWDEVLKQANLNNAIEGLVSDKYGQVPVSKEMVIALNPDILFIPAWVYGDEKGADKFKQDVLSDPSLQSVNAIKEGRVYQMPHVLRSVYSQYIIDAILFVNHSAYKKL